MGTGEVVNVFIVAASDVVRVGLESLTANDARFTVVGSAPDLTLLGAQVAEGLSPDVVILEVEGQRDADLSALHSSLDELNEGEFFPAFVLIGDGQSNWVKDALQFGVAWALLPRSASSDEIIAAVEAVSAGLVVLDVETLAGLLSPKNLLVDRPASLQVDIDRSSTSTSEVDALTPREREVLEMLAEGLSNKEIAWRMKISEHTVKFHVASIFAKFDVSTRTEAVMKGIRQGLVMM